MSSFNKDFLSEFLGVVRKYMQMRGNLSQKDLAEAIEAGVSTMSRFLNGKNRDIDPQLIAKIVAYLDIPLYEVVEFIEEDYTARFKNLVNFYKGEFQGKKPLGGSPPPDDVEPPARGRPDGDDLGDALSQTLGTAQRTTRAQINMGGRKRTIPFVADESAPNSDMSLRDKMAQLTPRQKAYLSDFLDLDLEARDLMVDLGNSLFRYFKQKGLRF